MLQSLLRQSRTARVPLQNGQIALQRVSVIRQSKPSISRVLTSFIISYCVISTASHLFPKKQDVKPAQADSEQARSRVEGLSKVSGPQQNGLSKSLSGSDFPPDEISIPLLLYIRQRRGPPYRPDDPEWKTFQRLQQDKKLLHDIKVQVAQQTEKQARKQEQLAQFFQVLRPGHMRVNLELVVPLNRPPVYEVPYVVIKPGGEAVLVWRCLPDSFGSRLDRAFHPIILSKAFYHGLKEFWTVSYRITKARLQDRFNPTGNSNGNLGGSASKLSPLYMARPRARPATEEEKEENKLPIRRASESEMKKMLPFLRGEYGEHASRQGYRDAVRSMTYQAAIDSACAVFRLHWAMGQSKAAHTDARDPCHIIGYIEFVGDRGKLRLDVFAVYSPKAKSLIGQPAITKAYGIPDATKWYEPLRRRRPTSGFLLPEQTKKTPALKEQPQSTEDSTTDASDEKERREVGAREEEGDGEK
ncbi:hypothetical protein A1O1_05578 [Capronia coronata CBS 617.96]|uniref:Uncharacterized protein n=1 Tax=Capronia coronata CBS 617.96 TaxID=1182541 RepID=W9Y726_9EURO|nr:uncharacterized protein A1O1_05578 [Capronia coronata CBS 617.96]EXJ88647.1 hypothetical protein A1O1_05578 [Capronia coronata CBS 617.96]